MGKAKKTPLEQSVVEAIAELETVTNQIRLKLHLAALRKENTPPHVRKHHVHQRRRGHHVDLDDGEAFLPDFRHGFIEAADADAEAFGEEFIVAATSAEAVGEFARDEGAGDELGGWYTEVWPDDDWSGDRDASAYPKAR